MNNIGLQKQEKKKKKKNAPEEAAQKNTAKGNLEKNQGKRQEICSSNNANISKTIKICLWGK